MLEKSISNGYEELPYLIRLLDDESPAIRETVISRLLELGVFLDEELELQGIQLTNHQREILDTYLKPLLKVKTLDKRVQENIFFTPGTLVQHKKYSYRGVIVAFDRNCLAPDSWYLKNKTQPKKNQPWYHVFVHKSDLDKKLKDNFIHEYAIIFNNFDLLCNAGACFKSDPPCSSGVAISSRELPV